MAAPTSADAHAAAEDIHYRRIRCHDPALSHWPDPLDQGFLFAVVGYVARYRKDIALATLQADITDQLLIINFLHEQLDHRTLNAITRAHRDCGMSWRAIAGPLGVTSRQGAEQTWQRLRNAFRPDGGRRSEVDARRHNRLDREVESHDVPDTTAARLAELIGELMALHRLVPADLYEELTAVRDAPKGTLTGLRWLLGALRESPEPLDPRLRALVDRGTALLAAR